MPCGIIFQRASDSIAPPGGTRRKYVYLDPSQRLTELCSAKTAMWTVGSRETRQLNLYQELLTLHDRLDCQFHLQVIERAVDAFDGDIVGAHPAGAVRHKVGKVENIL